MCARSFPSFHAWLKWTDFKPGCVLEASSAGFGYQMRKTNDGAAIFVVGIFPQASDVKSWDSTLWTKQAIGWTLLPPEPGEGTCWKSLHYSSTLPYAWIVDEGSHFFGLFIAALTKDWLKLCDDAEEHLSERVSIS